MAEPPRIAEPPLYDRTVLDRAAERAALIEALHAHPATISPKYLYDALGCALFAAICELDEYYPTRTERAVFARHGDAIADAIGPGAQIVDLGSGDGAKAEAWFGPLAPCAYVAVDFAAVAVRATLARLQGRYPTLRLAGVVTDFSRGLELPAEVVGPRSVYFYPGSSIGNFVPDDAVTFLRSVRAYCAEARGSALLIGVDTRKDARVLEPAYDDAVGVTAAFNRNVLRNVNRIIGSDFDLTGFAHRVRYDERAGRIEMYLEAMHAMQVRVGDAPRAFAAGERIGTEHSYKYAPDAFRDMLRRAGFTRMTCWTDEREAFAVFCAS